MSERLELVLLRLLGGTAFPRLAYLLRWPTRLGPRGLLLHVALNTALLVGLFHYVMPRIRRHVAEHQRLRAALGRDPTMQELAESLGWPLPDPERAAGA